MERTRNWGRVYRLKKQPPITLFHAGALFWRALNSDVWAFTLTIITLLLVGWRPLTWFVFMRPGSRDLARELA